ncbi:UNVERIFIED_CONTAM: hypothetical protein GTU68_052610, partial [Idotea baltica]|nr:hypothetical protein [Idotea baltica]
MARVTVEDCVDKLPNRFEVVMLASHRARAISTGSEMLVERDEDKNPVVALREIAETALDADDLREEAISSLQKHVEVDEPEDDNMAALVKTAAYNPKRDGALIERAFLFGEAAHAPQKRANGEPYFIHPIAVANLLADLRLDDATIATALLHDVVEDTSATQSGLSEQFGDEISDLVAGVTKLSEIERREAVLTTREEAQAENFRRLILAVAQDARVLLVKLADRLHNMRTLGNLSDERRERISRETMEVYAPLAGRMGMQAMREELEDLAMRTLVPGARTSVLRRFARLRKTHGAIVIESLADEIRQELLEIGIKAEVKGRQKRPYSIWRKMEREKVGFENLSDIAGFRVVTETVAECYAAVGAVHQRWKAVPGRFKDYISNPKGNG